MKNHKIYILNIAKNKTVYERRISYSRCILSGLLYHHFPNGFWAVQLSPVRSLDDTMIGTVTEVSPDDTFLFIYAFISRWLVLLIAY